MKRRGPSEATAARSAELQALFERQPYRAARERLVRLLAPVPHMYRGEQNQKRVAALKAADKELGELESALLRLADRVESGPQWSAIEDAHGERGTLLLKTVTAGMRELAAAAQQCSSELPTPQARAWLTEAALLFVHMVRALGGPLPAATAEDPAVVEFAALLFDAGHELGEDRAASCVASAIKAFDCHMPPPGLSDLI